MKLQDTKDGWYLTLNEGRLGYIHIDFRLMLDLTDSSGTASLTMGIQCRLKGANTDVLLTPEKTDSLAPILPLFNAKVLGVVIKKTGQLTVEFENDYFLEVDSHEKYEAWQLGSSINSGFLMICSPGGSVSLFREKLNSTRQP